MGKRAKPAAGPTWLGRLWLIEESSHDEVRMPEAEAEWGDLTGEWGLHRQLIGNEVAVFDGWLRAALKAQGGVSWRMRFWHDYILAVEWLGVLRSCNQRKGPGLGPRLGWWLLLERKGWDLSGRGVKSREGARFCLIPRKGGLSVWPHPASPGLSAPHHLRNLVWDYFGPACHSAVWWGTH